MTLFSAHKKPPEGGNWKSPGWNGGAPQAAGTFKRSLSLRMLGDNVLRVERPGADLDSPTANNVGDEEEALTARIARLAVGSPIYQAGLNQLC